MIIKKYSKNFKINTVNGKLSICKRIKKSLISFLVALSIFIGMPNYTDVATILTNDNNNTAKDYLVDEDGTMNPILIRFENPYGNSNDMLEGSNIIKNNANE